MAGEGVRRLIKRGGEEKAGAVRTGCCGIAMCLRLKRVKALTNKAAIENLNFESNEKKAGKLDT